MHPRTALACVLALASASSAAFAQAKGASATPPPAPPASALGTVAHAIAVGLGAVKPNAVVAVGPLASDIPATRGDELSARVAALVAGQIGGTARALPGVLPLAAARGEAAHASALVYLQVQVRKGQLQVTADEYPLVVNAWDRVRLPPPPPSAHAFAAAPIDAEVRAAFPPILLEQARVHKATEGEGDVLAAACGDLDGDGGLELALVSRARVVVGRLRGGQFVAEKTAPWSALAPRAQVPLREPIATGAIEGGRLMVGITDRGGVATDGTLGAPVALRGLPVGLGACAAPAPEASAFGGDLAACEPSSWREAPVLAMGSQRYDAAALFDVVQKDGAVVPVSAVRDPQGKLRVRVGGADRPPQDGVGAQIAGLDMDLDGVPEVAFSADVAEDDSITVMSFGPGDPRVRLRLPAPGGVRALAACPPEERGAPALVAVVGSEVWVVR